MVALGARASLLHVEAGGSGGDSGGGKPVLDCASMGTDADWERFAQADPYFAVRTDPAYRNGGARDQFFATGERLVADILSVLQAHFEAPERFDVALDFGCGVGRILLPLASRSECAIGVDVAPTMLRECRKNVEQRGLRNVVLRESDDELSRLEEYRGRVSLITSTIVFQHIPPDRGTRIFTRLVDLLAPGGWACVHLTFASHISNLPSEIGPTTGIGFAYYQRIGPAGLVRMCEIDMQEPVMQMNHYSLNEISCLLIARGISSFLCRPTDHDGTIGGEMYFRRPLAG